MEETEINTNRYVIYARKSTEEGDRQVQSIPRQVSDCKTLAERLNLTVIGEPIEEARSAKQPNNRPKFSQLMKDISSGKIDGIIAWHPDRLARNMIEGGRIIHMLDVGTLKDIKFHSHQFSNDANGKMLLGMLFVFAKHYSDDLSSKVTSGNKRNLSQGRSGGTPKHGYIRKDNGMYEKDNKNFELMKQAWLLRAEGKTGEEVANFLTKNNYQKYRKDKKTYETMKVTKSSMGRIFNDSFYYGLLNQADQTVDLRQLDPNFEPMISEDIFAAVQTINRQNTRGAGKKNKVFLPLRELVYCGNCGFDRSMIVSTPQGGDNRKVLRYTCRNKACNRKPKTIVGKVIFDEIALHIKNSLKLGVNAYGKYQAEIKELGSNDKLKIRTSLQSARGYKTGLVGKWNRKRDTIAALTDAKAIDATNQEIAVLQVEMDKADQEIIKYEAILNKESLKKSSALTKDQLHELLHKTSSKLLRGNPVQKDLIVRELFLKVIFEDSKLVDCIWKYPFDELQKLSEVSSGQGERT